MLLYLSWSRGAAYGNHLAVNETILQHVRATFLNLEELIEDHKLQVDSDALEVRKLDIGWDKTKYCDKDWFLGITAPSNDQIFQGWIFRG